MTNQMTDRIDEPQALAQQQVPEADAPWGAACLDEAEEQLFQAVCNVQASLDGVPGMTEAEGRRRMAEVMQTVGQLRTQMKALRLRC